MAVDKNTVEGYFKEREGELVRAVPEWAILQNKIPWEKKDKLGELYRFPVFLTRSHGVTLKGGASARTVYTLNDPKSAQSKDAQVVGSEITMQEDIAYGALAASSNGDAASFGDLMDETTMQMEESARFYLELQMLRGGTWMAAFDVITTAAAAGVIEMHVSAATWAPGSWSQLEGACVDVYDPTYTTKRNTTTDITVTSIDADTQDVILTGLTAEVATITATDVVVPRGWKGNTMSGLDIHMTNTGTLHGIDAAAYSLWKPNTQAAGGVKLTMDIVQRAVNRAVVRGLKGPVEVLTSPYSFTDMNTDLSALRRYAEDTKQEMTNGTTSIKFYGSNGASISIVPHPMVNAGDSYVAQWKHFKRIGSQDITFKLPGADGQNANFFHELPSQSGFRLRCWGDQGLIGTRPACMTKISGIVPASL